MQRVRTTTRWGRRARGAHAAGTARRFWTAEGHDRAPPARPDRRRDRCSWLPRPPASSRAASTARGRLHQQPAGLGVRRRRHRARWICCVRLVRRRIGTRVRRGPARGGCHGTRTRRPCRLPGHRQGRRCHDPLTSSTGTADLPLHRDGPSPARRRTPAGELTGEVHGHQSATGATAGRRSPPACGRHGPRRPRGCVVVGGRRSRPAVRPGRSALHRAVASVARRPRRSAGTRRPTRRRTSTPETWRQRRRTPSRCSRRSTSTPR